MSDRDDKPEDSDEMEVVAELEDGRGLAGDPLEEEDKVELEETGDEADDGEANELEAARASLLEEDEVPELDVDEPDEGTASDDPDDADEEASTTDPSSESETLETREPSTEEAASEEEPPEQFAEENLRKGKPSSNRLGTIVFVCLALAGLGFGLFGTDSGAELVDDVTDPVESLIYGPPPDFTNAGIFEAVAVSKWEPAGPSSFVEVDGERRAIRNYQWDEAKMRVGILAVDEKKAAAARVEKVEEPRIALQFNNKVVVLEARGETEPMRLREARRVLVHYRRMMRENEKR